VYPALPQAQRKSSSLVGDANNTASRAGTGIASLQGLLVAALAKIISAGVDDNGAADNALGSDELDELVGHRALSIALAIGLEVAKVTNVADLVGGSTMVLAMGVEMGASRGAAVGVVTKGVDVEAALGIGVVAGNIPGDDGRGALALLLEDDGAGHLGVTTEDADSLDHFCGLLMFR
jgi:hypothetical protein